MDGGSVPNEHTLLLILSACSHAGLLEEGVVLFESAREGGVHFLEVHFNALLDLLARGGRLHEAGRVITAASLLMSNQVLMCSW